MDAHVEAKLEDQLSLLEQQRQHLSSELGQALEAVQQLMPSHHEVQLVGDMLEKGPPWDGALTGVAATS